MTQADSLNGLGKPPDDVEAVTVDTAPWPQATHTRMHIPPVHMRRHDLYKWEGVWQAVSSVIAQSSGATAVHFRALSRTAPEQAPAIIPEGVYAVTVYRPNHPQREEQTQAQSYL